MKNIFKKISFLLMIAFCGVSLIACTPFDDENNSDRNIGVMEAVYKNQTNEHSNLIETFAKNVMSDIMSVYGYDESGTSIKTLLDDTSLMPEKFYEAFMFVYSNTSTIYTNSDNSSKWLWSFNGKATLSEKDGQEFSWDTASSLYNTDAYKSLVNNFKAYYTPAFKAVVFEVALNKTPSVFTINKTSNTATISLNGKSIDAYLEEVKQEYINSSDYIGLTEGDVETLKQYVISNVIGENASILSNTIKSLASDNDSTLKSFNLPDRKYNEVVNAIFVKNYNDDMKAKPNSTYSSSLTKNFSATDIENEDFESHQYQSIILTSHSVLDLDGLSFMIYSDQDFEIDITINLYDLKTKTVKQTKLETMNISANSTDTMIFVSGSDFDDDYFSIGKPHLSGFVVATKDLTNAENAELAKFYKVTEQDDNCFISFDDSQIEISENQNYIFEICFDTTSDAQFRFGLFMMQGHE